MSDPVIHIMFCHNMGRQSFRETLTYLKRVVETIVRHHVVYEKLLAVNMTHIRRKILLRFQRDKSRIQIYFIRCLKKPTKPKTQNPKSKLNQTKPKPKPNPWSRNKHFLVIIDSFSAWKERVLIIFF